ncbi:methylcrotonoyl-CoA carboxylase beta chain, mitochondrial-like isoform X2 [Rhinatrema bivittatum]|nr:methylcrotonoyl-CoA carboxylase beta chain, mitochondrial-like isoform X2 [Rhinatrema bivittatum]XP_029436705.1 methylcrotonoyl-CoA carboxylase beta chain, mitochondrial-like isoform X2 [Rhinatrema bivittatum]XP_029436706.1 methylcrotonoyl-CoA carboxylase beta chain, mitochondrial-like isoform X2 [Rhinatrema bivittatum]XP_029436707.1 methylcrotonoyl-CoA carboxylase beta chain, mitochondrial-like isoform X2 [Rhinatrema bivittatum]XP_029436708.1 methylcrotonoyl-CoA carboxylase beta chain, mito
MLLLVLGSLPSLSSACHLLSRLLNSQLLARSKYKQVYKGCMSLWLQQSGQHTADKVTSSSSSYSLVDDNPKGKRLRPAYPVLNGNILDRARHVYEANARNSKMCGQKYRELLEKVSQGGGENAVRRHTERNKKVLVRERLRMLLDEEPFLELSPFAGLGLPYGDVPSAGCLTGVGSICGIWCVFIANDATVKGGTIYPISVKKQLRAQEIAIQNRLPTIYLVDSGGAFLPLQAELFPDAFHGGRMFYNEAIMSAMKIPQVAVVCGSCTAGGAYISTMAEETLIVDKIGTIFLGGPPLVKAATGEDVSPDDLGGAKLHARISGCVDHFASSERDSYECVRNIVSTLDFHLPRGGVVEYEDPLFSIEELPGLAPCHYNFTLDVKLILSRLTDGSRFQEFKAEYGTTLVTGFAHIEGYLVGIVANNGELTHNASLKGSHFVQLCDQRNIPILFLQNTASQAVVANTAQAEDHAHRLKAQASMMGSVACATMPKITLVIGGCCGVESFAMCGRSFNPNFLFLWPNARVAMIDPRSSSVNLQMASNDYSTDAVELQQLKRQIEEESTAFYSSARLWDDGVILPQDTRKVVVQCLRVIKQQMYQNPALHSSPVLCT